MEEQSTPIDDIIRSRLQEHEERVKSGLKVVREQDFRQLEYLLRLVQLRAHLVMDRFVRPLAEMPDAAQRFERFMKLQLEANDDAGEQLAGWRLWGARFVKIETLPQPLSDEALQQALAVSLDGRPPPRILAGPQLAALDLQIGRLAQLGVQPKELQTPRLLLQIGARSPLVGGERGELQMLILQCLSSICRRFLACGDHPDCHETIADISQRLEELAEACSAEPDNATVAEEAP